MMLIHSHSVSRLPIFSLLQEADTSQEMNVYHKGVLSWFFKKSIQDIHKIGPPVEWVKTFSVLMSFVVGEG